MSAFADLLPVAELMHGFSRPWFIAGGWALDLFLGRMTREHEDVDVALFRVDQGALREYLAGWEFTVAIPAGGGWAPWRQGEWLQLPVHEIHARRIGPEPTHLEFLLNESGEQEWRFRKNPAVTLPLGRAVLRSPAEIPFLCPEIVLLYKATTSKPAPRNEVDLDHVHESLDDERRLWLRRAIGTCRPGHPWLERL